LTGHGLIDNQTDDSFTIWAADKSHISISDVSVSGDIGCIYLETPCDFATVRNCCVSGSEYGIIAKGDNLTVEDNRVSLSGWQECQAVGISLTGNGIAGRNHITVTLPSENSGSPADGLSAAGIFLLLDNDVYSRNFNAEGMATGITAAPGANETVLISGGSAKAVDISGIGKDITKGPTGSVYVSGTRYTTKSTTIVDLDERAATNVWDDAIPGSPTAGSRDERLKALDEDFGTKLSGITSLAAWLRGLFRKDEMDATAKGEVNDDGGTYDEATDSQEAKQEYAVTIKSDAADAKTAAEAVDTLTKADGDGDLAEVASNVAETLATMPSAATIAAAVWDATTRTLSSFGTLVASIWAAASRTLTGSTLGLGPTASRSRTDGYYTCPQSGTIGLYRRILGWDGADLQQADVQSIAYSIFALSDDDPPERTAVEGHKDVELDKIAVLFDEVQSDEWASDYNFKHIPDISTNQAFPEADAHYLVEYRLTPTAGQVIVERIKVRAI